MKKELSVEVEIPEGVEVNIEGNSVNVKGSGGESKKTFNVGKLNLEIKDNKVFYVLCDKSFKEYNYEYKNTPASAH